VNRHGARRSNSPNRMGPADSRSARHSTASGPWGQSLLDLAVQARPERDKPPTCGQRPPLHAPPRRGRPRRRGRRDPPPSPRGDNGDDHAPLRVPVRATGALSGGGRTARHRGPYRGRLAVRKRLTPTIAQATESLASRGNLIADRSPVSSSRRGHPAIRGSRRRTGPRGSVRSGSNSRSSPDRQSA
jgi:hypothetical protein